MERKKHYLRFTVIMTSVMAVILAVLIVANILLLSVYPVSVNNLLSVTENPDGLTINSTISDWKALAETIEGEGTVLLRNENNTLPLAASEHARLKVNLLGERAYNPVYGGTGSGSGDSSSAVTLPQALNQNGFEVNPAIEKSGIHSGVKYDDGHGIGMGTATLEMNEAPLSVYTGDPFGYGLSYTTFTQEIVGGTSSGSQFSPTGTITLQVKVTNTGSVAGKEVVQAYLTAPYTDYDIANGVEKAEVSLIAYAKTDLLQPGESQTVELSVDAEDMASYDESCDNGDGTTGSYMLDAGTYTISVRKNAHTAVDSIDVELDSQYFYSGNNKRSSDDQAVYNQLQDSKRGIYLSRNNGFANYEEAMNSVTDVASEAILAEMNAEGVYDKSAYDDELNVSYTAGVDYRMGDYTAKSGDLTLADMAGVDYDDERWDKLLSQMSVSEMASLVGSGGWSTVAVDSIDKVATTDVDGPSGVSSMFNSSKKGVQYPATIVLVATWNVDLARTFGEYIADEAHEGGVAVTDACTGVYMDKLSGANKGVRSGQDLWLAMGVVLVSTDTDADIYYVMRSAKNILYAQANSALIATRVLPWQNALYAVDALLVVGFVVCGVFLIRNMLEWKKSKKNSQKV